MDEENIVVENVSSDEDIGDLFYDIEEEECESVLSFNKKLLEGKLIILNLNVRSLNANFEMLKVFIERLKYKPHVIVCAETWLIKDVNFFKFSNYNAYYNESCINQADGVLIFVDKSLDYDIKYESCQKLKIVSCIINCNSSCKVKISGVYRCHDYEQKLFISNMEEFLALNKKIKNHYIVGDFNIDILQDSEDNQTYLYNFLESHYLPLFKQITRPNENSINSGTCIDNSFAKTDLRLNATTLKQVFTDHYPLFTIIDINFKKLKEPINTTYIDYKKLEKYANKTPWHEIEAIHDPDKATNELIVLIKTIIDKATTKKKTKRNKVYPRKNWITTGIITSCSTKENLYKIWQCDSKNLELKKNYKDYEKILNKIIKDAKYKYDQSTFNKCGKDSKSLWSFINKKINRCKKNKNKTIDSVLDDGKIVTDKNCIADVFNKFFGTIGENLAEKIDKSNNDELPLPKYNTKCCFFTPISPVEILLIIDDLKDKAGGVDGINAKVLKKIALYIVNPLTHIFNLCISTSVWPNALKSAEIVPIYKSGNKQLPTNYRPISLISNIAKILEKSIHNRIYNFFNTEKLLSDRQYGFRKKMGTKDAHAFVSNKITENIDKNNKVIGTFLDLAKAFDTVNHEILLRKLDRYGIRGTSNNLIKSYLHERQQKTKINDCNSQPMNVTIGVPQGTILGPLLFAIYINDLLDILSDDSIVSYADDTVIFSVENNWYLTEKNMNEKLDKVYKWLNLNQLSLNAVKTVYIAFGSYQDSVPEELNIFINDHKLQRVEYCKYLGLYLDYRLKWNTHIDSIVKKTKYLIYIVSKLAKFMNENALMTIYYALFHSISTYGVIAWGSAYNNVISKIQVVQSRIIKIVKKGNTTNYPLTIKQTFLFESISYNIVDLLNKYKVSDKVTRSKLTMPKITKTIKQKSSVIVALKIFMKFEANFIIRIEKIKNKKATLKTWIKDNTVQLLKLQLLSLSDIFND